MKKCYLVIVLLTWSIICFSQNGGQANENASSKIEEIGFNGTYVIIKVTNKQNCTAEMRVSFGNDTRQKSIPALASDTFYGISPQNNRVTAKTLTNCGVADFGLVELVVCKLLAVKNINITARKINNSTIELLITSEEDINLNYYRIDITFGNNKMKRTILFPDGIIGNKTYKIILKK